MTHALQDLADLFSVLHDGSIAAWRGDITELELTIECEYLAELIDKSYTSFTVILSNVSDLKLNPWTPAGSTESILWTDLESVFQYELEILQSDVEGDMVLVTTSIFDDRTSITGGNLYLACKSFKIRDQGVREMTLDQLKNVAELYWSDF